MPAAHVSEALRVVEGIERLRLFRARSMHEQWIEAQARLPAEQRSGLTEAEIRTLSLEELVALMIEAAARSAPEAE
jgi:hypothetical protein